MIETLFSKFLVFGGIVLASLIIIPRYIFLAIKRITFYNEINKLKSSLILFIDYIILSIPLTILLIKASEFNNIKETLIASGYKI